MTNRAFISESEVQMALDYLRDQATEAAQARADRVYAEEYRKVIKAGIMKENQLLPLGAQEREAYSDPRYMKHLAAIQEAVAIDEKHRFLMRAAEAKLDCWRTMESSNRSMKL